MRLLHTSDWHLGRSFHGTGMLPAQERFADQLVETVRSEGIDAVLVAGDVYDRALPGVDAVALFDETLSRLADAGAAVVATSGNHDSALRLGFGARLLSRSGVHLLTDPGALESPVVLPGDGFDAAVYGLPYLEPRLVADRLGVDAPGHAPVLRAALDRVRASHAALAATAAGPVHPVVMAHVFAAGSEPSDSERVLAVGGLETVPVPYFADFAYAALGHLHGRQRLADNVRYSGSPLAYSFSEASHSKGAWLVELTRDGLAAVQPVDWTPERALAVLTGPLEELLADPALSTAEGAWCQVTLTDRDRPVQAMERVRRRFPHTLELRFAPAGGPRSGQSSYRDRLAEAENPLEVCAGFVDHVRERPVDEPEGALLQDALGAVVAGGGAR